MAYKVKKVESNSNPNKKKKTKDPNKFHLGRNTGTKLIILLSLVGIALIAFLITTTVQNVKYFKENKAHPYVEASDSTNSKYNYENATFMEGKDFDLMDIKFYANSIDTKDAHSASFSITCVKNENTNDNLMRITSSLEVSTTSSYMVYTQVCLAADKVGLTAYSTLRGITKTNFEKEIDKASASTITVSLDSSYVFPMKTSNWPFKTTVKAPDAYLFVCYYYSENGLNKKAMYVLHYSYSEYYIAGTTSPAI